MTDLLWELYNDNKSIKIRNIIVEHNMPLVTYTAKRLRDRCCITQTDLEDLVSYGTFGLIDAVEKFNFSKGFKFSTYATFRINGSILDELRKLDWVPRSVRKKINNIKRDILDLENNHNLYLTDFDIYKLYHLSEKEINLLKDTNFIPLHNVDYVIDFIPDFENY